MAKKVEYKGKKYKIGFISHGYSTSKFVVNGETSSTNILNCNLTKLPTFKEAVKEAIREYIDRQQASQEFRKWDGKL